MTRRRLASGAGLLGLFAVLTAVMTWPQVREISTGATPHQDVYLNMWRMQWFRMSSRLLLAACSTPTSSTPSTRRSPSPTRCW